MISTTEPDIFTIDVTYNGTVNGADFSSGDFLTTPSSLNPNNVNQLTASKLELDFGINDISGETDLTYTGVAPGVETPQTISL